MTIDVANPGADEAALGLAVRNLVKVRMPMRSGRYYRLTEGPLQSGATVVSGDAIYAFPFYVGTDTDVEECYAYAMDIQADPSNALFAIYSDDNGLPGSPILQSGVVDMLAVWAGNSTIPLNIAGVIPAGWNWFAYCVPVYTPAPDLVSIGVFAPYPPDTFGGNVMLETQTQTGSNDVTHLFGAVSRPTWVADLTFAGLTELPDPFPGGGGFNSAAPLAVQIKVA